MSRGEKIRLEFDGRVDPNGFLEWITAFENMFGHKGYSEERIYREAKYKFSGYALKWWKKTKEERFKEGKSKIHTWKKLKKILTQQFLPKDYKEEQPITLREDVNALQQGLEGVRNKVELILQRLTSPPHQPCPPIPPIMSQVPPPPPSHPKVCLPCTPPPSPKSQPPLLVIPSLSQPPHLIPNPSPHDENQVDDEQDQECHLRDEELVIGDATAEVEVEESVKIVEIQYPTLVDLNEHLGSEFSQEGENVNEEDKMSLMFSSIVEIDDRKGRYKEDDRGYILEILEDDGELNHFQIVKWDNKRKCKMIVLEDRIHVPLRWEQMTKFKMKSVGNFI